MRGRGTDATFDEDWVQIYATPFPNYFVTLQPGLPDTAQLTDVSEVKLAEINFERNEIKLKIEQFQLQLKDKLEKLPLKHCHPPYNNNAGNK